MTSPDGFALRLVKVTGSFQRGTSGSLVEAGGEQERKFPAHCAPGIGGAYSGFGVVAVLAGRIG